MSLSTDTTKSAIQGVAFNGALAGKFMGNVEVTAQVGVGQPPLRPVDARQHERRRRRSRVDLNRLFHIALALVRRELWAVPVFSLSPQSEDRVEIPRALWNRMSTALGYAA